MTNGVLEMTGSYKRMTRRNMTLGVVAASIGVLLADLYTDLSHPGPGVFFRSIRDVVDLVMVRVLITTALSLIIAFGLRLCIAFHHKNACISVVGDMLVLRADPNTRIKIPEGDESIWIRRHRSGKWWLLGSTAEPRRTIRVSLAAYPTLDVFLRERLGEKSFSQLCTSCGYNLRATTGRCPECGNFTQGSAI